MNLSLLVLLAGLGVLAGSDSPVSDALEPPPYGEFLVIPLRVHVLSATDLAEVDCGLKDADIYRILAKANGIWHRAGVHFGLESLLREPAAEQDRFRAQRDLTGAATLGSYPMLTLAESRDFAGLHVYYVHQLPVNGVYFGEDFSFVQEIASLRPVPGGIEEPLPRVTSHELGHALSLVHRQNETNLMASGTTGTLLNTEEVQQARAAARKIRGAMSVAEVEAAASEARREAQEERARQLKKWLQEIPGRPAEAEESPSEP